MATKAIGEQTVEVNEDDFDGGFSGGAATGEQGGDPDPKDVEPNDTDTKDDDPIDPDPRDDDPSDPDRDDPDDADARQALSTLRGKYNAEVPKLHETLKAKDADLSAKDRRIKELEEALAARPEPDESDPEEFAALEQEAPAIAGGVRAFVSAIVSRTLAKEIKPLRDQLAELPGKIIPDQNELLGRAVHFATIAARHPDHGTVVGSKEFDVYVNSLPQKERDKARTTLKQGSAADVIGLIGGYKKAKGLGDPFDSDVVTSRPVRPGHVRTRTEAPDKDDFDAGFEGKK